MSADGICERLNLDTAGRLRFQHGAAKGQRLGRARADRLRAPSLELPSGGRLVSGTGPAVYSGGMRDPTAVNIDVGLGLRSTEKAAMYGRDGTVLFVRGRQFMRLENKMVYN